MFHWTRCENDVIYQQFLTKNLFKQSIFLYFNIPLIRISSTCSPPLSPLYENTMLEFYTYQPLRRFMIMWNANRTRIETCWAIKFFASISRIKFIVHRFAFFSLVCNNLKKCKIMQVTDKEPQCLLSVVSDVPLERNTQQRKNSCLSLTTNWNERKNFNLIYSFH